MKYLRTMTRIQNLEAALDFFVIKLGLIEIRRSENPAGKYTNIFVATEEGEPSLELTYNWDQEEPYSVGRNFGHVAYSVKNIYDYCEGLQQKGVKILRPPRDGKMAFIRSPDQISVELLQEGEALPPQEPWFSMPNHGEW